MNSENQCWSVQEQSNFLLATPQRDLSAYPALQATLDSLPEMLANPGVIAAHLPLLDFADVADCAMLERLFAAYGYIASAIIHAPHSAGRLPQQIAVPFLQLAQRVGRPPMLSYAAQVLGNWQRCTDDAGWIPENIALLQHITGLEAESWFFRVHIAIEAQATDLIRALQMGVFAAQQDDNVAMQDALRVMRSGLVAITQTFHRMPDYCDPDVYYQQVRPFLFGFEDVIYETLDGARRYRLRGGSGAQSSIVPAVLAGLGVLHSANSLTRHLHTMRAYMPIPHQQFIEAMQSAPIRDYCASNAILRDAYNHVLRQLMTFRRAHLYYARAYIFAKTTNPIGTGGTDFMSFLSKLIDETDAQLLR